MSRDGLFATPLAATLAATVPRARLKVARSAREVGARAAASSAPPLEWRPALATTAQWQRRLRWSQSHIRFRSAWKKRRRRLFHSYFMQGHLALAVKICWLFGTTFHAWTEQDAKQTGQRRIPDTVDMTKATRSRFGGNACG